MSYGLKSIRIVICFQVFKIISFTFWNFIFLKLFNRSISFSVPEGKNTEKSNFVVKIGCSYWTFQSLAPSNRIGNFVILWDNLAFKFYTTYFSYLLHLKYTVLGQNIKINVFKFSIYCVKRNIGKLLIDWRRLRFFKYRIVKYFKYAFKRLFFFLIT